MADRRSWILLAALGLPACSVADGAANPPVSVLEAGPASPDPTVPSSTTPSSTTPTTSTTSTTTTTSPTEATGVAAAPDPAAADGGADGEGRVATGEEVPEPHDDADATTDPTTDPTSDPTTDPTTDPVSDETSGGGDGVVEPPCVVTVGADESLDTIVAEVGDPSVDAAAIVAENRLAEPGVWPGAVLDVCVDNGVDDVTGAPRAERAALFVERERAAGVMAQQTHLNSLFAGLGIAELQVDGISGPVTRQRLCAFRLAVGLPVSTADMEIGGDEERQLMSTTNLPIPYTSAILGERWILIDQTCQIMFVGAGAERLQFVFPTSTGQARYPTRLQNRSPVYRYDPADDNGGWHDSTVYPASNDNPLNGNMYRPLYFDGGQAIHGANNVPRSPASHGCARLRLGHQDALIAWLGLVGSGYTTNRAKINVTVNVQGVWRG